MKKNQTPSDPILVTVTIQPRNGTRSFQTYIRSFVGEVYREVGRLCDEGDDNYVSGFTMTPIEDMGSGGDTWRVSYVPRYGDGGRRKVVIIRGEFSDVMARYAGQNLWCFSIRLLPV